MALCQITGKVVDGSEVGIEGANIHAVPFDTPAIIAGTDKGISPDAKTVATSSTGLFEIDLIRLVKYTITIPIMGYRETVAIPDEAGPVTLWTLSAVIITAEDNIVDNW